MKSDFLYRSGKRLFDIVASGTGIVLTSPIFLISSVGIELSDPGPIFYLARRAGKDNKPFRMFKFRSMRVDREANEKSLRPDQDRIFPFGRFLRATKIDELPQLVNILLGSMTVVGPRPAAMDQLEITRGGENAAAAALKPGLTSPSALYDYIYGDRIEDETEYNEKVLPTRLALDRYYLGRQSAGYDLKMILYTMECILCTAAGKVPIRILEELFNAVDGDRRALDKVREHL